MASKPKKSISLPYIQLAIATVFAIVAVSFAAIVWWQKSYPAQPQLSTSKVLRRSLEKNQLSGIVTDISSTSVTLKDAIDNQTRTYAISSLVRVSKSLPLPLDELKIGDNVLLTNIVGSTTLSKLDVVVDQANPKPVLPFFMNRLQSKIYTVSSITTDSITLTSTTKETKTISINQQLNITASTKKTLSDITVGSAIKAQVYSTQNGKEIRQIMIVQL
jgi:hypothetical protein